MKKRENSDCIILTRDNKILLQQRPLSWERAGGCLTIFGGKIEDGESPEIAVCREVKEELGAEIKPTDLRFIGKYQEIVDTDGVKEEEIIHIRFWHDNFGKITGCYEGEAVYYDRISGALNHPKIMDYVVWALNKCKEMSLLK